MATQDTPAQESTQSDKGTAASTSALSHGISEPRRSGFPDHDEPRVWFLAYAAAPLAVSLARKLLDHGDIVVGGVRPSDLEALRLETRIGAASGTATPAEYVPGEGGGGSLPQPPPTIPAHLADLHSLLVDSRLTPARQRFRLLPLDPTVHSQCQAAIASTLAHHGKLDVLFVNPGLATLGTVEELVAPCSTSGGSAPPLARAQFETTFFASVALIGAALPVMRAQRDGHLVVLTGITAHLGTPGLGIYCAAQWALEGYCDSLAYEVAPFNVRTTIVQPNVEVGVLTGRVVAGPSMWAYSKGGAPLFRQILGGLMERLEEERGHAEQEDDEQGRQSDGVLGDGAVDMHIQLDGALKETLMAETLHAIISIGGHPNPPSRHIVGHEGVASVKEKLKTVSEEMEDFVEASAAVDI